jgi:hypothetical protein
MEGKIHIVCVGHVAFILKKHLENLLFDFNYEFLIFILDCHVFSFNI